MSASGTDDQSPTAVWSGLAHPGYRRSMDAAGTVAAPMLAGFSFTLFVLVLPELRDTTATLRVGSERGTVVDSGDVSRFADPAAILLLLAGLLLVACVQSTITARYHGHTPSELEELYPEYFCQGAEPPESKRPEGWSEYDGWSAIESGGKWYGGWVRSFHHTELGQAIKAFNLARLAYHAAILSLLAALTLLAVPAEGDETRWRWALTATAALGLLVEAGWILSFSERVRARLRHFRG